jgi:hypothetical protein
MNYKKISTIIIPILLIASLAWYFFCSTPHYNIIPIDSYAQAFTSINSCNTKTLITFDVDNTLTVTDDPILNGIPHPLLFKIWAGLKHPTLARQKTFELIASIIIMHAHFFLIEDLLVQTIKDRQHNGCNIIGLTAIETGTFGIIPSFEEWRAQMLHDFGIDFINSFNTDITLDNLPLYHGTYPRFVHGIVYTNMQPKGDALCALLEKLRLRPEAIVSFDDELQALESIAHACAKLNIPFTGYQYNGAKKVKPVWNMNEALAELDDVMKQAATQTMY